MTNMTRRRTIQTDTAWANKQHTILRNNPHARPCLSNMVHGTYGRFSTDKYASMDGTTDKAWHTAAYGTNYRSLLGHPEPVRVGARHRTIQTGRGLLCPGRQRPERRPLPRLTHVRQLLQVELMRPFPDPKNTASNINLIDCLQRGARAGFHPKGTNPFPNDQIIRVRTNISNHLNNIGHASSTEIRPGQPFALSILAAMAQAAEDTEHILPAHIHNHGGVPLGAEEDLPEIRDHWPADRMHPDPDIDVLLPDLDNYNSAIDHLRSVRETYEEERALGMAIGPLTYAQTVQHLDGHQPILLPPGAKPEDDKVRNIQDGTVPGTNVFIHQHC